MKIIQIAIDQDGRVYGLSEDGNLYFWGVYEVMQSEGDKNPPLKTTGWVQVLPVLI